MVSFKSLAFVALSVTAVTAVPQHSHARFHARNAAPELPQPVLADEPCPSQHTEYVTSTNVATITRRWDHTRGGGRWTRTQAPAQGTPAASNPEIGVSVGVSVGAGADPTATASADSSQSTSPSLGGSSAGGKKGLSYNSAALLNVFSSAGASWSYNWAAAAGGTLPSGIEYVPMLWGKNSIGDWAGAAKKAIAGGSKAVLSFNEPDFPEQANIGAAEAAKLHIANVASLSGQVEIGSPAITNSNIAGQGLDWMTSFLAACGGAANLCKLDFLAFHWYNNPGTIDDFKSHVSQVINLAKKNGVNKVWLTEFAVNGGTDDQATFLKQALPFLDAQPEVERYAYFMVGNGQLLSNGALNAAGKAYSS